MKYSFIVRLLGLAKETKGVKYKDDTELLVKNRLRRSLGLPGENGVKYYSGNSSTLFIA